MSNQACINNIKNYIHYVFCSGYLNIDTILKRSSQSLLLALFLAGIPVVASTAECEGVAMEDSITQDGHALTLNGLGLRLATFLKIKVYVAGLYVPTKSDQAKTLINTDQPWRLKLSFVRSVDKGDMVSAWDDGFSENAKAELSALKDRIETLNSSMEDLKEGETLMFSYTPGKGTNVEINGKPRTIIEGADFASALLSIWLGNPPNKEIKRGLLGGKC